MCIGPACVYQKRCSLMLLSRDPVFVRNFQSGYEMVVRMTKLQDRLKACLRSPCLFEMWMTAPEM